MNRLTDNDKNFGPFTFARWRKNFSLYIEGRGEENNINSLFLIAFGWALRLRLPGLIRGFGKYCESSRRYGFSLSNMGNGYDFFQLFYGPQTYDSSTTKSWSKHLPWKQWRCVRNSLYFPDGSHFATEQPKKFFQFMETKEKCPASKFEFADFDGEKIIATCVIEEREWHRGEGWFSWLRWLYPAKIRRSLDIKFSAEVGTEKGSWKGGTIGHGIDMIHRETPLEAFKRYCTLEQRGREGRKYRLTFIREL